MFTKSFFRDDFIPVQTVFGAKSVNVPKLIPGELVSVFVDNETKQTFVEMSTGIIYYRYNSYAESSPYGFEYLEKSLINIKVTSAVKYPEFEQDCKYLHSKLLLEYRQLIKNNKTEELNQKIAEYKQKLKQVYQSFNKLDYYSNIEQLLESQRETT